ncbi:MAG TPA: serine/threonine-protein kinase [Kofleriaceae bacterium]|nr:serine/threonine-protein kinase [Kofleriaceae bacterium]
MQNSPARAGIDVGSVIAGTYTIEALIGRGGMGAVFLASHARLPGKKIAVKVLHAEMSGDEILARFKREAQIASMLSHPNIVHIEDYNVTEDGTPYLVLEYLQGESLAQRLKRGPLAPEQAFSIIRQVGSALAAAHQKGIVHRDLKPQNIFLVPSEIDGRAFEVAKVLDFGISKMRDSQTVKTQESALLGTPQYMAPEQATGQHASVDERTDIFALGAIVYEMLAGHPAFSGASIPEVVFKVVYEQPAELTTQMPTLSAQIAASVHRAMSKPAGERYSSVSEFIEALTGNPLAAPRSGNSLPPPDVGFTTGSRMQKETGNDAFANTVGSGDHADAVAATVDSGNHAAAEVVRGSSTVSTNSGQPLALAPTMSQPRRPRAALFIAGGLAVAAIATVAVFAMRGANTPAPPAPAERQVAKQDQAQVIEKPEPVEKSEPVRAEASASGSGSTTPPVQTEAVKVPAKTGTKTGSKTGAKTGSTTTTATANDDGGDATLKQKLNDADVALRASEWGKAEQLANAVINSEDANPKQKARASLIHGTAQCLGRNNQEGALMDLRRLKGAPGLRAKLLNVCKQADILLER